MTIISVRDNEKNRWKSNAIKKRETNKQTNFLLCSSVLVSKWQKVLPVNLELELVQVTLYTRKDLKSSRIGSLYEKKN